MVSAMLLPAASAEEKPIQLFNGKDLSGWVVEGRKTYQDGDKQKPIWTVRDGEIHCAGKGYGFLRYDRKFCDYVLRLEYNMSKGCNSGVGIRGVKFTSGNTRPSAAGFELQILDDAGRKPTNRSGMSLYRYRAAKVNSVKPAGEWNKLRVECRGPVTRVTLNGKLLHDVDHSKDERIKNKPLCGYISVQNHGHTIRFRNLEVVELKSKGKTP